MSVSLPKPGGRFITPKAPKKKPDAEPTEPRPLDITPQPKTARPRNPEHPRPSFGLRRPRPVPTAEPEQAG